MTRISKEYANPGVNADRPIWPIDSAKRPAYCFSLPADYFPNRRSSVQEQKASSKENPSPEVELAKERNGNHKIGPTRRQCRGGMTAVTAAAWAAGAGGVSPLLRAEGTATRPKARAP